MDKLIDLFIDCLTLKMIVITGGGGRVEPGPRGPDQTGVGHR